jgi:hypothetical protein
MNNERMRNLYNNEVHKTVNTENFTKVAMPINLIFFSDCYKIKFYFLFVNCKY